MHFQYMSHCARIGVQAEGYVYEGYLSICLSTYLSIYLRHHMMYAHVLVYTGCRTFTVPCIEKCTLVAYMSTTLCI